LLTFIFIFIFIWFDITEFVSHYSAAGGMRDGFNYLTAFLQDAIQNENYSKTKLTLPVLDFGAGYSSIWRCYY